MPPYIEPAGEKCQVCIGNEKVVHEHYILFFLFIAELYALDVQDI